MPGWPPLILAGPHHPLKSRPSRQVPGARRRPTATAAGEATGARGRVPAALVSGCRSCLQQGLHPFAGPVVTGHRSRTREWRAGPGSRRRTVGRRACPPCALSRSTRRRRQRIAASISPRLRPAWAPPRAALSGHHVNDIVEVDGVRLRCARWACQPPARPAPPRTSRSPSTTTGSASPTLTLTERLQWRRLVPMPYRKSRQSPPTISLPGGSYRRNRGARTDQRLRPATSHHPDDVLVGV